MQGRLTWLPCKGVNTLKPQILDMLCIAVFCVLKLKRKCTIFNVVELCPLFVQEMYTLRQQLMYFKGKGESKSQHPTIDSVCVFTCD